MEEEFAQMKRDIAFLKEQLGIHAKNTEAALARMADANKASAAAVEGNAAHATKLSDHNRRLDELEKAKT